MLCVVCVCSCFSVALDGQQHTHKVYLQQKDSQARTHNDIEAAASRSLLLLLLLASYRWWRHLRYFTSTVVSTTRPELAASFVSLSVCAICVKLCVCAARSSVSSVRRLESFIHTDRRARVADERAVSLHCLLKLAPPKLKLLAGLAALC